MQKMSNAPEELASILINNFKINYNLLANNILPNPIQNRKVIFIVGAGASHAIAGLPLGKELANDLIKKLGCNRGALKKKFENLLSKMEQDYGFDKDDFKTILFSLNQINSELLIDGVQDVLLNKYVKSYTYDFIASLLFKGYVDAVVNFNFDEILDTHILDKFSMDAKLFIIYSDENFPAELSSSYTDRSRLNKPVYIKPHGTISQRQSLRFARKDFYQIEPKQKQLLEHLFSNIPVTLVIVGFRLKFFEFSQIIEKSLAPGSKIFIIDKNEDILDPNILKFYEGEFLQVSNENSLDMLMQLISKLISNQSS